MFNYIQKIKSIKIKQLLTTLIVGCLLVFNTACSQDTVAQAKTKVGMEASKVISNTYDDYDADQSFKGGMNGYNDDRRYDAKTAAKTKQLIDTAKSRKADNIEEFADNVGERSVFNEDINEKATKAFSRKLENNREKAVDYIQDKSENLKDNLSKVPGGVENVVQEAGNTAQDAVEDASRAAQRTAKEIKGNFEDLN